MINNINNIPIYLQKYLIKILCNHINLNNKLIDCPNEHIDYRENESEINKLTLSISLVNKSWFKTIQKNLDVSVDLNFSNNNNSEYSIIKFENVKTLKLHYHEDKKYFYKLKKVINKSSTISNIKNNCEIIENKISIDSINNALKLLSNSNNNTFKRLILRNVNTFGPINVLNNLYSCNVTENNIELIELEINSETGNLIYLNSFKDRISKLFSIIYNFKNFEDKIQHSNGAIEILDYYKMWYLKGLKRLFIYSKEIYFPMFQLLSNKTNQYFNKNYQLVKIQNNDNINYLENIQLIDLFSSEILLDDLLCLFSPNLLPNLNKVSFEICFNKLNYYFLQPNSDNNNLVIKCNCNCIIFREDVHFGGSGGDGGSINSSSDEDLVVFKEKWKLLFELIKSNKSLNCLKIKHNCKTRGPRTEWKENKFNNNFIENQSEFISSFKNLTTFCIIGPVHPEIFEIIKKKQSSIIHFESIINISNSSSSANSNNNTSQDYFDHSIDQVKKLIIKYPDIKSFKIIKIDFINTTYQNTVLYEYKIK